MSVFPITINDKIEDPRLAAFFAKYDANQYISAADFNTLKDAVIELDQRTSGVVQLKLVTTANFSTSDLISGEKQGGKNIVVSNGVSAINITLDGVTDEPQTSITYLKTGVGTITFIAGAGRTLVPVNGINQLDGVAGSRALVISDATTDYLFITNY